MLLPNSLYSPCLIKSMRNVVMGFVLYMVYTGESILLDKMAAILADDIAKCIFLEFRF